MKTAFWNILFLCNGIILAILCTFGKLTVNKDWFTMEVIGKMIKGLNFFSNFINGVFFSYLQFYSLELGKLRLFLVIN